MKPILANIEIKNFKGIRDKVNIDFNKNTYLIGLNNSGKSNILHAIDCFFNENNFNSAYINRTNFLAKKAGFNKSQIIIKFNPQEIKTKKIKTFIKNKFSNYLRISKTFTYRETTNSISIEYYINSKKYNYDDIPQEIKQFLYSFNVSYIHPQQGEELLKNAQDKLKNRIIYRWENAKKDEGYKQISDEWKEIRKKAGKEISEVLTKNIQSIWPGAEIDISLPDKIQDLISISDIIFKTQNSSSNISLNLHGTGAQSTVLYQTHYILDNDKKMHKGEYHSIWLLEEPESFLHKNLEYNLASQICSTDWLNNIQIITSTHSPIILGASSKNKLLSSLILTDNHEIKIQKNISDLNSTDFQNISSIMGDEIFKITFELFDYDKKLFIEDIRDKTKEILEQNGLNIYRALNGTGDISNLIKIITKLDILHDKTFNFLIDNDSGVKTFKQFITENNYITEKNNLKKYKHKNFIIILLPKGFAMEELFSNYKSIVYQQIDKIYNNEFKILDTIPHRLSRVVSLLRKKQFSKKEDIYECIKNEQDIKDILWAGDNFPIENKFITVINEFIE